MHADGSKYLKFQVKSIYYFLCIRPINVFVIQNLLSRVIFERGKRYAQII